MWEKTDGKGRERKKETARQQNLTTPHMNTHAHTQRVAPLLDRRHHAGARRPRTRRFPRPGLPGLAPALDGARRGRGGGGGVEGGGGAGAAVQGGRAGVGRGGRVRRGGQVSKGACIHVRTILSVRPSSSFGCSSTYICTYTL